MNQLSKPLSPNVLTLNDMPNWVGTLCLLGEQLVGQDVGQGHQIKLWKRAFDDQWFDSLSSEMMFGGWVSLQNRG